MNYSDEKYDRLIDEKYDRWVDEGGKTNNVNNHVEPHEFAGLLKEYTRDELQKLCESLLDSEKELRKELDEAKGIIR